MFSLIPPRRRCTRTRLEPMETFRWISYCFLIMSAVACSSTRMPRSNPPTNDPALGTVPTVSDETDSEEPEVTGEASERGEVSELNFEVESLGDAHTVQSDPKRPMIAPFDLCGDGCKPNVELQKSMETYEETEND